MNVRSAAVGALVLGTVLGTATAVHAHDQLVASDPAHDEQLDTAPDTIRLSYSGEVLDLGTAVVLADQDQAQWPTGEPQLAGRDVEVAVLDELPDGRYEVRWRVVSSDGHPISGVVPFVVGDPPPPAADRAPDAADTAADTAAGAAQPADADGGGWSRTALVGAAGAGAALLLLLIVTRWLPRGHRRTAPGTPGAGGGEKR